MHNRDPRTVTPQELAGREAELLREFLLSRVEAGADLRSLALGLAAELGKMSAICAAPGYLESTLEAIISTIRYNSILVGGVAGSA